jgi:hypothetical protein
MTQNPGSLTVTDFIPQWSRPQMGRMTSARLLAVSASPAPQWSRPQMGRMTAHEI